MGTSFVTALAQAVSGNPASVVAFLVAFIIFVGMGFSSGVRSVACMCSYNKPFFSIFIEGIL
jgi:hypothetical protein